MDEQKSPLNDSVKDLNKFRSTIKNSDEVKNKEPGALLLDGIAKSSIEILQSDVVLSSFSKLIPTLGEETSKTLIELLTVLMTQSAFAALTTYDEMLKEELDTHFNGIIHNLNLCKSDIEGYNAALKVFKRSLEEIKQKIQVSEIIKDNKI